MTPTDLQTAAAILALLRQMGSWPIVAAMILVVGPWAFSLYGNRVMEKRFEAMKAMYENNVKLVKCYEELAGMQNDIVTLNTAKWAEALEKIDTNQFCPVSRVKKRRIEDIT